jgi:nanoRNase/pAp phosphatase (c-di-AMP/oligoRNAs hydrolase)
MITNEQIHNKVESTTKKISTQRLNNKLRLFQKIELPFITIKYIKKPIKVSRQRLRLYLDLVYMEYPDLKYAPTAALAEFITETFKCECTEQELLRLRMFKDITTKKVITMKDNNVKQVKRIRWRHKNNVNRNRIHI